MACDHVDPEKPWTQRGETPPVLVEASGRPRLDRAEVSRRYREAKALLGPEATVERLAEAMDISPRTLREWRRRFGLA